MKVWLNGELLDEEEARISPFDHGLLVGDGVFETLRVYDGVPFAWTRHLARLHASAAGLMLPVPGGLREAVDAVIEANAHHDGRVRITITGGPAPPGSARAEGPPTLLVASAPLDPVAPTIDVSLVPWPRSERSALAGIKSISYAENVKALAWAADQGAGEALFGNLEGNLCEGTGTNVFLVERGRVVTPPLSAGCLAGVTRGLVLELCVRLDIPRGAEDRPVSALPHADEAFLTSTTREVQQISRIGDRALPGAPGPVAARLADAFTAMVREDPDP